MEKALFVHRVAVVTGAGHPNELASWQGFGAHTLSPALILGEGKPFAAIGNPRGGPDSVPHATFSTLI